MPLIDLTGKRFGKWTVVGLSHKDKHRNPYWDARCDCGTERKVIGDSLRRGLSSSCGCLVVPHRKELTGLKFGRLSVIGFSHTDKEGKAHWDVLCKCGTEKKVYGYSLRSGAIRSCGCLKNEKTVERFTTHGMTNSKTYRAWQAMKARCLNPNHRSYHNYGGRGIQICEQWKGSFSKFVADMGEVPDRYTLDRINNSKGYSKDNCRWASYKTQARNMRRNVIVEYKGIHKTLPEWAEIIKIHPATLRYRIRIGWQLEKAFSQPAKYQYKNRISKNVNKEGICQ